MNCFLMISLLLTQPQDAKTTFPPAQGAPELKAMKPGQDSALTPAQAEHAAKLIRDLESSKYQVRQEATAELKRLGPALVPLLMKVRTNPPSLETLCRVEMILREIMPVQAEASAGARSFFGIIKVNAGDTMPNRPLVHGTDHAKKHDRNNDWQKKSPLSTPKKDQPYDEDKRIKNPGKNAWPGPILDAWKDAPPTATIGLGTGSMATWGMAKEAGAKINSKEPPNDEIKRLQGRWLALTIEVDGQVSTAADLARSGKYTIASRDLFNDKKPGEAQVLRWDFSDRQLSLGQKLGFSIRLDPSKSPKWIDLVPLDGPDKAKTSLGIYRFDDDRLTICLAGFDSLKHERPRAFKTAVGSGLIMIVLEPERTSTRLEKAANPVDPKKTQDQKKTDANRGNPVRLPTFSLAAGDRAIERLVFSPDGKTLAAGDDSVVRYWDWSKRDHWGAIDSAGGPITFCPTGYRMVARDNKGNLHFWYTLTGRRDRAIPQPFVQRHIAFSPDGTTLAIVELDSVVQFLDANTGEMLSLEKAFPGVDANACYLAGNAFSFTNGRSFVWISRDSHGVVRRYDLAKQKVTSTKLHEVKEYPDVNTKHSELSVFAPNGKRYLRGCAGDERVCVWDSETGKAILLPALSARIVHATFSVNGDLLALASAKGTIEVWQLSTNKRVEMYQVDIQKSQSKERENKHPPGVRSLAFSLDGRLLAAGLDTGRIAMFEVSIGDSKVATPKD